MKKGFLLFPLFVAVFLVASYPAFYRLAKSPPPSGNEDTPAPFPLEIRDVVKTGETMFDIFQKYGIDLNQFYRLKEASADVHRLRRIRAGSPYKIALDADNNVLSLTYRINHDAELNVVREEPGFRAEKVAIAYEVREVGLSGVIENNLISSLGETGPSVLLALDLSDIFSWDIDFASDIRKGDSYRVVVDELWLDGEFQRYGKVAAAEFTNSGTTHRAYRYEVGGRADYFDGDGNSLRRAFLKAPLSFRRISSRFSRNRLHPVLRVYRPHHGVDYVAPQGTPVSALGEGTVRFAGWKGANGQLVVLSHPMGYRTFYGHLSRIARGIRPGARVRQGEVIGYVGATGRATGPHLHFEIHRNGRPLNPLTVNLPRGKGVPEEQMADFRKVKAGMAEALASILTLPGKTAQGSEESTVASSR
jgi:murein DD-endopeptidase MepM/ murein hydrolase activator NlpD